MDKHNMAELCNGLWLSHKKEQSTECATMWMNLENMTLSEKPDTKGPMLYDSNDVKYSK